MSLDNHLIHNSDLCPSMFITRHNPMAHAVNDVVQQVGYETECEIGLVSDLSSRKPGDVGVYGMDGAIITYIDVCIGSPFSNSAYPATITQPNVVVNRMEKAKAKKYADLRKDRRFCLKTFAMPTYGVFGGRQFS